MKRFATLSLSAAALLGVIVLTGCASDDEVAGIDSGERVTAKDIWDNPTPELNSAQRSWAGNHNRTVRTIDHNLRGIVDDWDRLWLLERPSELVPYPIP